MVLKWGTSDLLAETRGKSSVTERQGGGVDPLVEVISSDWLLAGCDQVPKRIR